MCTEAAIKDNVVVVYELLEEMLDNGFPLATESNILKELIKPPTILRTVVNTITGIVLFCGVLNVSQLVNPYKQILLFVICAQEVLMLASSFLQVSCQWYHGGAQVSNIPTTKLILTWWKKSMLSLTNQVDLLIWQYIIIYSRCNHKMQLTAV